MEAIDARVRALDPRLDLHDELSRLRRERKAVILAHYYQDDEIQDLADFTGDSLQHNHSHLDPNMNQDLSIIQLVLHASVVVQAVMLLLMAVSIASWAAIFRKLFALNRVKSLNETFEREFWSGTSMNDLFAAAAKKQWTRLSRLSPTTPPPSGALLMRAVELVLDAHDVLVPTQREPGARRRRRRSPES